ncbi:N-acyl homoserine lactonase family protein [Chloroflexota bacterium]
MATYSIYPIALCEGPRDCSHYTYTMNAGVGRNAACYIWYIEGSEPKTLVDAGVKMSMYEERGIPETYLISVEEGLGKLGLKPDDIEIIIVTHLHWDHIGLSHLFPNARFIVQKKELDYARNPHPIDATIYEKDTFENLDIEVIDGEKEIIPGVSAFLTPGHTPGGQSVEIATKAGKAIITGFCCILDTFTQNEVMKRKGWEVSAPLIHQDVRDAYDSVLKVKQRADIILATHDYAFVEGKRIP